MPTRGRGHVASFLCCDLGLVRRGSQALGRNLEGEMNSCLPDAPGRKVPQTQDGIEKLTNVRKAFLNSSGFRRLKKDPR